MSHDDDDDDDDEFNESETCHLTFSSTRLELTLILTVLNITKKKKR